jgi:ribosomal protein L35AE/L33A
MYLVRIAHPVPSFEGWKRAFDNDPVGRQRAGVLAYRVMRPVDDPAYAMIDLEFDTQAEAEAMVRSLRELWGRVEGRVMSDARVRVVETVEARELARGPAA